MSLIEKIKSQITSFQVILLGFAGVILLGSLLLMLPISSAAGVTTTYDKALFTATSAVCVTGLVVYDTATHWSYFGQAVLLILIQTGGLGVVTVASSFFILAGRKIGLMQRQTMKNSVSAPQLGGMVRLTGLIFLVSGITEAIGAMLLLPVFVPRYGAQGIWMSVFHSVSAYCNAGFDLMGGKTGEFSSLTGFAGNGYITVVIGLLIILGGIGFLTWDDILTKKWRFKEYHMQTKVILGTSLVLVALPTIYFFFAEYWDAPIGDRIWLALFQAISPRTAGFNTADLAQLSDGGKVIDMALMLIGGSPGSTAGGIKTTTIAVLFANAAAVFRQKPAANFHGRRVEDTVIKDACTILLLYVFLATASAIIISRVEHLPIVTSLYETVSAIATVGLTLGITTQLSAVSRVILIFLMFFGRVGGLTIIYAALTRKDMNAAKYPIEHIMVG